MPNEFVIKNGFRSQGNSEITGSLTVTGVGNGIGELSHSNLIFASGSEVQITGSLKVTGTIAGTITPEQSIINALIFG